MINTSEFKYWIDALSSDIDDYRSGSNGYKFKIVLSELDLMNKVKLGSLSIEDYDKINFDIQDLEPKLFQTEIWR